MDETTITVVNGVLAVKGEREDGSDEREGGDVRRERRRGSFRRSIVLPPEAEADKIAAATGNGVAGVTVPVGRKPAERIEIRPSAF